MVTISSRGEEAKVGPTHHHEAQSILGKATPAESKRGGRNQNRGENGRLGEGFPCFFG